MAKFYFTYGTDPAFPYQGGWTEIEAEDLHRALSAFKTFHPNRNGSECYNFAFVYAEDAWENIYDEKDYRDHKCREQITVAIDTEKHYGDAEAILVIEHVSYSRTIIDDT